MQNRKIGICPSCGGNMFHSNSCKYGAPVTNSSSYDHQKYGTMFKKSNIPTPPTVAQPNNFNKKPGHR